MFERFDLGFKRFNKAKTLKAYLANIFRDLVETNQNIDRNYLAKSDNRLEQTLRQLTSADPTLDKNIFENPRKNLKQDLNQARENNIRT